MLYNQYNHCNHYNCCNQTTTMISTTSTELILVVTENGVSLAGMRQI